MSHSCVIAGSYTQAQRAASLPMPSSVPARVPITLSAPVQLPPPPSMASTQNLGLPRRSMLLITTVLGQPQLDYDILTLLLCIPAGLSLIAGVCHVSS